MGDFYLCAFISAIGRGWKVFIWAGKAGKQEFFPNPLPSLGTSALCKWNHLFSSAWQVSKNGARKLRHFFMPAETTKVFKTFVGCAFPSTRFSKSIRLAKSLSPNAARSLRDAGRFPLLATFQRPPLADMEASLLPRKRPTTNG